MGKVIAVCISEKKGTQKTSVHEAQFIKDWGDRRRRPRRKVAPPGQSFVCGKDPGI